MSTVPHVDPDKIQRFIVQHFNEPAQKWLSINDRIFVREHMKPGTPHSAAVAKARSEADRQVSGWQSAYPLRQYRHIAAE